MSLSESVWKRETSRYGRSEELSAYAYRNLISLYIVEGLALSSMLAFMTQSWQPHWLLYLAVGLVIPIIGIFIALHNDQWQTSFFGYQLVVIGLGCILGPSVAYFETTVIINALVATLGVTILLSIVGITTKKDLSGWGSYLFFGLCTLLVVRVVQLFLPVTYPEQGWWWKLVDYAGALLFSLYIVYDWNRAMQLPKTKDNAVDVALAIYLDIVNLFLHLLRILGGSSSKD